MHGTPHLDLLQDTQYGFISKAIPSNRIYNPTLLSNSGEQTMLATLKRELAGSNRFKFSVAFITPSALAALKQELLDFKGQGIIYTSTYLDFNDPAMFEELLNFRNIEVRVLDDTVDAFHSKGYIFYQDGAFKTATAIIGSSNLTRSALTENEEWNLKFSAADDGHIIEQLNDAIDRLHSRSQPLTSQWIRAYESRRKTLTRVPVLENENGPEIPVGKISPNLMQQEALAEIKKSRDSGNKKALVISATGTGKTILAALAVREARPQRVLFIVHREQILNKAIEEFQKVLDMESSQEFGKFVGQTRELSRKYVFATVQTLSREYNLSQIARDQFDFIIIDEVHRAGADSYRRIMDYFTPQFMLGLTATPERSDDTNVYELFDFNVAYEIRLEKALKENMLVPFSYFGVRDYTDASGQTIEDTSSLKNLVLDERVDHIVKVVEQYGHTRGVKGLFFCSRNEEAYQLSEALNTRTVNGRALRTVVLTGDDSQGRREEVIRQLEEGRYDYILTVDIFNEGIDIPQVNQVVMLRNTQSAIVFTQQLGRGLRKCPGKTHLRVIDFIGNYKNNFLIPIALFGDNSLNKDVIRQRLAASQDAGSIAGISNISFEKVALERVLSSLDTTKLTAMVRLRAAYKELRHRLGRAPQRLDFARFDTPDPTVFLTQGGVRPTYWHVLKAMQEADVEELDEAEQGYLTLLDRELLNGKRPQELLLLKELLRSGRMTVSSYRGVLDAYGANSDDQTITSVVGLLSLSFFPSKDKPRYGKRGLVERQGDFLVLLEEFSHHYRENAYFRSHVDDSIEAGLYLNRHRYNVAGDLHIGKRYSRKDVCRMLNWPGNYEATMYGYKADSLTATCPIFVTYHKSEDIDDAIKYQDRLEDETAMTWFTKHGRTLESKTERAIVAGDYRLDVFVKKDDSEGTDFFYLGRSKKPQDAHDTIIQTDKGNINIVSMRLEFEKPLSSETYKHLTSSSPAGE